MGFVKMVLALIGAALAVFLAFPHLTPAQQEEIRSGLGLSVQAATSLPSAIVPDDVPAIPAAPSVQTAPADSTDYEFASGSDARPTRWNPCQPIHYVVNPAGAPGALEDVQEAFRRLGAATGITFVYDGTTQSVPTSSWTRKAGRPVLVGWATPGQTDLLAEGVSGNGGATKQGHRYIAGSVVLNSEQDGTIYRPGFGPGQTRGNLLLHELGHVVGLGHAHQAGELMHGSIGPDAPDGYSAGDLAGLVHLGTSAGCL